MNDSSPLQALFAELLRHSMHVYKGVTEAAVKGIGSVCKRYPCLALPSLPYLLAALAKLPLPDQAALEAAFGAVSASEGEASSHIFCLAVSCPCAVKCLDLRQKELYHV